MRTNQLSRPRMFDNVYERQMGAVFLGQRHGVRRCRWRTLAEVRGVNHSLETGLFPRLHLQMGTRGQNRTRCPAQDFLCNRPQNEFPDSSSPARAQDDEVCFLFVGDRFNDFRNTTFANQNFALDAGIAVVKISRKLYPGFFELAYDRRPYFGWWQRIVCRHPGMHCEKVRPKLLGDLPCERQRSRSRIGKVCCKDDILDLNSMGNCHCWFHRPPPLPSFIYPKIRTAAVTSVTPRGDGCNSN